MVFNKSVFKKLIKTAYKTCGLLVANKDDRIILAGSWWMMSVKEKWFPKWGMAAVIELTGAIPAAGECFRAEKMGNQIEILSEIICNLDKGKGNRLKRKSYTDTRILQDNLHGLIRYLSNKNDTVAINEMMYELYDPDEGENGESCDVIGIWREWDWMYFHTPACSWACSIVAFDNEKDSTFCKRLGQILQEQ